MPKVGFAAGLLAGAFNYISIVPFMLQNPKVFKDYKRKCAAKGVKYDLKLEMEMMGCTHAHVCSFILPALGLGVAASQLVTEGLLCELGPIPTPDKDPYRVYIATVWINSLMKNGAIPDITHKGGFYPLKADLDAGFERLRTAA
jgi:hypothetical protein